MILSISVCAFMACNSSDNRRSTDDDETPIENNIDTANTDSMGNDTRGAGDGKGTDHNEDFPNGN